MSMLVTALLITAPASAGERYLASEAVAVALVAAVPSAPSDAAWQSVAGTDLSLHAQRSVRLGDTAANTALQGAKPVIVTVRAAASKTDLGLLLEWRDESADVVPAAETNVFPDAIAVEIPQRYGPGIRLPYVGMGDEQEPVIVAMIRAAREPSGALVARSSTHVAAGFGSLTRAEMPWWRTSLVRDDAKKTWRALFIRPLQTADHALSGALVPFAVAVWQGSEHGRGANKRLSRWRTLRFANAAPDARYLEALSYGFGDGELGDAQKGKAFVQAACVVCHHIADKHAVPAGLAPELTGIGAIAAPSYLRDSVLEPSTVIVPSLTKSRHQDKTGGQKASGGYPSDARFEWSALDASGKRISKMPPFGLPKEQLADVIAYLRSLGDD